MSCAVVSVAIMIVVSFFGRGKGACTFILTVHLVCCSRWLLLFFAIGHLVGLCRMFVFAHHFVIVSSRFFRVHHKFACWVIECLSCFGCDSSFSQRVGLCLWSVCRYVLCAFLLLWLRFFLLLRVACVRGVSFNQSQHPRKQTHQKEARKDITKHAEKHENNNHNK